MDQTREKLHCAVCGWEWYKRLGAPDPGRCANPACRSKRWKGNAGAEPPARDFRDVGPVRVIEEDFLGDDGPRELKYEPIDEV